MASQNEERMKSFKEFYPYYLNEHMDPTCRTLHFIGTGGVIGILIYAIVTQNWILLWALPLCGYGFAWVGHFFFEKNKPATFKYPLWSLGSDFVMFAHLLIGKEKFSPEQQQKA
jgi:hypothetical protein